MLNLVEFFFVEGGDSKQLLKTRLKILLARKLFLRKNTKLFQHGLI